MKRLATSAGVVLVLVASTVFAGLNGAHRVTVRLGFATLYRVPVPILVFGSLILGMLVMLIAGISSDLRVRRILRDRLMEEDREEKARLFVDRAQTNLFDAEPDEEV